MENIFLKRRSIRKYTNQEISNEIIEKLLRAAMNAPSAGNEKPWEFIIVKDKEIYKQIMQVHEYSKMLKKTQSAILVCGNLEYEKFKDFWSQDCSAATQNILLAATEMGLGSVWLGIFPMQHRIDAFKEIFNLPEDVIPFSLIPIGYPAEEKNERDAYDASRIHYEKW